MRRCVIVGGADILNYNRIKKYLKNDDFFIFCDSGLKHKDSLSVAPDLIIGDFDSFKMPETCDIPIIRLPCEKDYTDTFSGLKEGEKLGFSEFLIIGVIGQRIDHSLANISMVKYLKNNGKFGKIVDDYSEISIIKDNCIIEKEECSYFSLISLSERIEGVCIKGAKYPLDNAVIENSFQMGVSNEPVEKTSISVAEGDALLIKIF